MIDMYYRDDGFWTHFWPVSDAGVEMFKQFLAAGCDTILSLHAKSFIAELRRAGYVVQRGRAGAGKWTKEDDDLLSELAS